MAQTQIKIAVTRLVMEQIPAIKQPQMNRITKTRQPLTNKQMKQTNQLKPIQLKWLMEAFNSILIQ